MSAWFLSFLPLAALVAAATFFSYGDSLRSPAARFAIGAVLLSAVVFPAASAVREVLPLLPSLPEAGEGMDTDALTPDEVGRVAFADGIRHAVAQQFSLREEEITVTVEGFSLSAMRARRIGVLLSGSAAFADAPGIRRYMEEENWGECHVDIVF